MDKPKKVHIWKQRHDVYLDTINLEKNHTKVLLVTVDSNYTTIYFSFTFG